jgi:hypothetical protein
MFIAPFKDNGWREQKGGTGVSRPAAIVAALLLLSGVFLVSLIVMVADVIR